MAKKPMLECLRYLLYPVVRFCLRHSLKLQDFTELAKSLFLTVAEEMLEQEGTEKSTSRLSIMTGVHRRDVVRLLHISEPTKKAPDLVTRVIGQWQNDRRFTTKNGSPRVLSYESRDSEFGELVAAVSREVNPYTVLFELNRMEAVEQTVRGLKLKAAMYLPSSAKEGFRLLGSDAEDLIHAVEQNVLEDSETPNLHIKTEYDNVPESLVPQIKSWLIKEGSSFHRRARHYLSKCDRDINPRLTGRGRAVRVAIAAFSRIETKLAVAAPTVKEANNDGKS